MVSESSIPSECQFAEMNGGSIIASVDYDKCNTQGKGQSIQILIPTIFLNKIEPFESGNDYRLHSL